MRDLDEIRRDYFHRVDPRKVEDAEDIELAYALQNSTGADDGLLARLVNCYSNDLYRWVAVLLYYREGAEPDENQILAVLQEVFSHALQHVTQFHGQASVFTWLFGIAYLVIHARPVSGWARHLSNKLRRRIPSGLPSDAPLWQRLGTIPEKLRTPLILRHLFGLRMAEIASILGIQVLQVHKRLVRGRKIYLGKPQTSEMESLIQAFVDGLYDEDADALDQIARHLEDCEECRSFISQLESLEDSLGKSLQGRWEPVSLDEDQLEGLYRSVSLKIQLTTTRWHPSVKLSQVAWVLGLSGLFVAMALIFVRLTPPGGEFPQVGAVATPSLPAITSLQPQIVTSPQDSSSVQTPQFIDPAISADGNWAVFSYIRTNLASQRLGMPTISLYNRLDNTIQVIGESSSSMQIPWVWLDLAPGISADGQLIVYVSAVSDTNIPGNACNTSDQHPCLDIFLYDRSTGATRRLTQSPGGGAADGDSIAPAISADGRWVAFWSAADNLVPGGSDTCQQSATSITCMYIYLYDMQSGSMTRIPLGAVPGGNVFGVDRISLSADGRYVGFTATRSQASVSSPSANPTPSGTPSDPNTGSPAETTFPTLQQNSEAVVYDRQAGLLEFENQTENGVPGNAPSNSPVLSADGRYVSFVSTASNLVSGDRNEHSDVFLRDRQTGKVELVSVSSDGIQGNNDSGVTFNGRSFYSLNLSSDGRYVVFQSQATNLQSGADVACAWQAIPSCNSLYVRDLKTGRTSLITLVPDQGYAFFPGISADGRWVLFTESTYNCSQQHYFCSNVMVFDQQSGWMTNLTKFNQPMPGLPWTNSVSLPLPWQARNSTALAFSPDGKLLILGGHDSAIRIWHVSQGLTWISQKQPDDFIRTPGNDDFTALAVSQDNGWLAAGTTGGTVYVWYLADRKLLYTLDAQPGEVQKLVFSQDGSHLIISTLLETWIWTIGDSQLVQEANFQSGSTAVVAVDISPKGNLLATARADGTVWLQGLPDGKLIARLGDQGLSMGNLAFSSDGSMLATRSYEGGIDLWTIKAEQNDQTHLTLLSGIQYTGYVGPLAFSPDDKYLVSISLPGEITLWSLPDGKMFALSNPVPQGMGYALAVSQGGNMMAAAFDTEIVLWGLPPNYASTYYQRANQDTFVDSPPLPASTYNTIPEQGPVGTANGSLDLGQAAALLKFPLLVPTRLPENLTFLDATVDPDGSVVLRYVAYQGKSFQALLYIYEKVLGNSSPPTITVGASADIMLTHVENASGRVYADYVRGDWILSQRITPPEDGSLQGVEHSVWTWDNTSGSQRLSWQQNGIFVSLYYLVNQPFQQALPSSGPADGTQMRGLLDQSDLVQVANWMDWYSQADNTFILIPSVTIYGQSACGPGCTLPNQRLPHKVGGGYIVTK